MKYFYGFNVCIGFSPHHLQKFARLLKSKFSVSNIIISDYSQFSSFDNEIATSRLQSTAYLLLAPSFDSCSKLIREFTFHIYKLKSIWGLNIVFVYRPRLTAYGDLMNVNFERIFLI